MSTKTEAKCPKCDSAIITVAAKSRTGIPVTCTICTNIACDWGTSIAQPKEP